MKASALLLLFSIASNQVDRSQGCSAESPCPDPNHCCSQFGYCGTEEAWCGAGCQAGPCWGSPTNPPGPTPPTPTPPSPTPPTAGSNYNYCGSTWANADSTCGTSCHGGQNSECWPDGITDNGQRCFADATSCPVVGAPPTAPTTPQPTNSPVKATPNPTHSPVVAPTTPLAGGDSRVIAYVGNWQQCPSAAQLDGYTHIVVAFAVTYSWPPLANGQNNCRSDCSLSYDGACTGGTGNEIANWKAAGKKVILSFGGAGMGGSWSGDINNCWDHCFGKEDTVSDDLVALVDTHGFDGVDLDYEYCYDTANRHYRNCNNSGTGKYSDAAAQTFLEQMTIKLRTKLDELDPTGNMELTHAPMDTDLDISSPYFDILKRNNDRLNFLMPQFYNGYTRPALDGFTGTGSGSVAASTIYSNLVLDMFGGKAEKVVFGFCISDCPGSNADGTQAANVMTQISNAGYTCNGGAFFWVALHDVGGAWSDVVYPVATANAGCSVSTGTDPPSKSPSKQPTGSPTKQPTDSPTQKPTDAPTEAFPGTCSDGSGMCSATDMSQCSCAARRNLNVLQNDRARLNKGVEKTTALRGKTNSRKLGKPEPKTPNTDSPTSPPTKMPTGSPVAPTNPPSKAPTNSPTMQPSSPPTEFSCMCNLPTPSTPSPTSPPTPASTPAPTSNPTDPPTQPTGQCDCGSYGNKSSCEGACGGNTCGYESGKNGRGCYAL